MAEPKIESWSASASSFLRMHTADSRADGLTAVVHLARDTWIESWPLALSLLRHSYAWNLGSKEALGFLSTSIFLHFLKKAFSIKSTENEAIQ